MAQTSPQPRSTFPSPGVTPAVCAAVVVTYHPDAEIPQRLERILEQVSRVYIVDNASRPEARERLRGFTAQHRPQIELIENDRNLGVAAALNTGAQRARAAGSQWLLTMDQDTLIERDLLAVHRQVLASHPRPAEVAVVGSNYIDSTGQVGVRAPEAGRCYSTGQVGVRAPEAERCYVEATSVITSGSLVRLEALEAVGPFREDFFIDSVDHEFCLRLRRHGYRVLCTARPVMRQRLGEPYRVRFLWWTPAVPNYPPLRRYYMTRNRLVLLRQYWRREPGWILSEGVRLWGDMLLLTLHETDRRAKLKAMAAGALDGLRGRMGPYQA